MPGFVFDTSSFIEPWVRRLPHDVFPGYWARLGGATASGEVISPIEVLHEVAKKQDDLYKWLKERSKAFVELDSPQQQAVREILARFDKLVKAHKRQTAADSFVIALARVRGFSVVTEESSGKVSQPKIPDVCAHYGIKCMNVIEFVRKQNWSF